MEPERQSIQIASLCLYYLQPSLMQKPLTCKKRWSVNWQAGPCDHRGQDFVPSLVRSKAAEALGSILGLIIASKNIDDILKEKYESQYSNIIFINDASFHDRFIILDRKLFYTCGASFKDLGKKSFAINEFHDTKYLVKILELLNL